MKKWKITTPALNKKFENWVINNGKTGFLCRDIADDFWNIPREVERIWVVVTSTEKKESVPITFQKRHSVGWEKGHKQKGKQYLLIDAQQWLTANLPWSKNGILKVWVTVEYE